ncbi:MAG TPA: hypothetical protein VGN63_03155 [Flavisolibacter sp.]|jgi:hypothetical protein|nr:hypothetical protein [Flavisolibacter sp.]
MQTTLNQTINTTYTGSLSQASLWSRFMAYCKGQEHNRIMWVGLALAIHGCALTPITVMATLFAGPNFFLFMTAMVAMGIALVTNLAAMPTKVTIPAFALSVIIDIVILISCVVLAVS